MDRIFSIIKGKDPIVLDILFSYYGRPKGKVVDLTCNKRRIWKGLNTEGVTFCDIDPNVNPDIVCDYCDTPFKNEEISVIVFDPPHLPSAGGTDTSLKHFVVNNGLKQTVKGDNISSIFVPFLNEANRILMNDGLIFAKLADYVHNHRYQWMLVEFVNAVNKTNGLVATDLIIKQDPSAGWLQSSKWSKLHHARRCHCWYVIVRKGRCEPRKQYDNCNIGRKL